MSASSTSVLDAVALQLLEALREYEEESGALLGAWPELERYRSSSEHIERIRMYSASLPELRAQCIELLIAHAEVLHFLWRRQNGDTQDTRQGVEGVRARHRHAVNALRERCVQLVTQRNATPVAGDAAGG